MIQHSFIRIPDAALADAVAIIARIGAGKSYTARGLVERLLASGARSCILDPTGVWWGLRLKPDGKTPSGLPIVILGGDYGDLPITPEAGRMCARLVIEHRTSFVVDMSLFGVGERDRFCAAFFDTLYQEKPRGPLHLIADEADAYAPQKPMKEQRVMASRFEQIVRRGRVRGFRVMMITQRTAVINKDVLNMAGTMVVLNLMGPQDRAAFENWIEFNASAEKAKEILQSLPNLQVGEGWVWSPRQSILERGKFPLIETYDSMRAPTEDEDDVELPELAGDVLAQMSKDFHELVEKAAAEEPEALKARVVELQGMLQDSERELEAARAGHGALAKVDEKNIRAEEYGRGFSEGETIGYAQGIAEARKGMPIDRIRKLVGDAHALLETANDELVGIAMGPNPSVNVLKASAAAPRDFQPAFPAGGKYDGLPAPKDVQVRPLSRRETAAKVAVALDMVGARHRATGSMALPKGERLILTALAQHRGGLKHVRLAIVTGYAATGGGFKNYLGALRSRGWIADAGDMIMITTEGRKGLGPVEPLPTGAALRQMWFERLPKGERLILEALTAAYPGTMTAEQVGRATNYEAEGGGFKNYLGRLRTLELVRGGKDALQASPDLFDGQQAKTA